MLSHYIYTVPHPRCSTGLQRELSFSLLLPSTRATSSFPSLPPPFTSPALFTSPCSPPPSPLLRSRSSEHPLVLEVCLPTQFYKRWELLSFWDSFELTPLSFLHLPPLVLQVSTRSSSPPMEISQSPTMELPFSVRWRWSTRSQSCSFRFQRVRTMRLETERLESLVSP